MNVVPRPIAVLASGAGLIMGMNPWAVSWHLDEGHKPGDPLLLGLYVAAAVGLIITFWKPRHGAALALMAAALHWAGAASIHSSAFPLGFYAWLAAPAALNLIAKR